MKITKMLTILFLGLLVWSPPIVHGAQYLTVNGQIGQDVTSITLELGQSCTVEIVSTDSASYVDYVGFDNGAVLGDFSHLETKPEAGNLAAVIEYDQPAFYGYYANATGISPAPSPGIHFVFVYLAQQVGETDLKLYDSTFTTVIDSIHITVIPLQPSPIGTAFTYQGRLMDSNIPANGLYDFEFKLYDNPDPVFAAQQGNTIDINDLDVIDGYFTAELDFGSNVFNGDARWLEIAVRPGDSNDPNAFVSLSPRQELTPTPYALQTRGIFVDKSENIGMGTTSPEGKLHVDGGKANIGFRGTDITIEAQDGGDGGLIGNDGRNGGNIILIPGEGGEPSGFGRRGRDGNVGIGTTPNERLTITGALSLEKILPPSETSGYGKIYVKYSDGELYFKNEAGTEYNLSAGGEDFIAGDYLLNANDTERTSASVTPILLKETKIGHGGSLRIKFDARSSTEFSIVYAQVRRNNTPVGTLYSEIYNWYSTFTEDISGWSEGDLVQVWGYVQVPTDSILVRNFRLYVDNPPEAGARL